jgi:hypothetical protein
MQNSGAKRLTRLCNLAGNEQELLEYDALELKRVGAIDIEQCNELPIPSVRLFVHYTYSKRMHSTKVKITAGIAVIYCKAAATDLTAHAV